VIIGALVKQLGTRLETRSDDGYSVVVSRQTVAADVPAEA